MIIARAPNHLGDGVMALPALRALAALGSLRIHAPVALHPLFRAIAPVESPKSASAAQAVLFPPSLSSAWKLRRSDRRIGVPTDARRWLLTDPIRPRTHRARTYAALARAAGGEVSGAPLYEERGRPVEVPTDHIGLNPFSRGGAGRNWWGFRELARRLERPVVVYVGPDEARAARVFADVAQVVVGLDLPDFAATLQRCALFVTNDTGPAHFARAVGVETLVVHLSTAPERTGAAGAHSIRGPRPPCAPCYRNRCRHDLACTGLPVGSVLDAVRAFDG